MALRTVLHSIKYSIKYIRQWNIPRFWHSESLNIIEERKIYQPKFGHTILCSFCILYLFIIYRWFIIWSSWIKIMFLCNVYSTYINFFFFKPDSIYFVTSIFSKENLTSKTIFDIFFSLVIAKKNNYILNI